MAKAKKKKKKVALSAAQEQRRLKRTHFREVRAIFEKCGFKRIPSASDKQITFEGTTSDLDDVFISENVIVFGECTVLKSSELSGHLKKKKVLYDKILDRVPAFLKFMDEQFPDFKAARDSKYQPHHFKIAIVYCARNAITTDLKAEVPRLKYLDYQIVRYFKTITDRVRYSSRYELYAFLGLGQNNVGVGVISPAATSAETYKGSILPEGQSHFPPGYKVVSFYVSPAALLERCYVLRKDGWQDDDGLYQRMILQSKIDSIRKYLLNKKRVFINNIIVTLPSDTKLTNEKGNTVDPSKIHKTEPGNIQLPHRYNSVGLIDGQHRVFSYYEGGKDEAAISKLRLQQNLLVTGVIYPEGASAAEKAKFEAMLFIEINANQANAKSDLKQAIGVLLNPFSQDSIARQIVNSLNDQGPLGGEFERYFFDKGKIKTTSIVSFGVKPIIKQIGADTFFAPWTDPDKQKLIEAPNQAIVSRYIQYCTSEINKFVGAVKAAVPNDRWTADRKVEGRMLSTTVLNGLIVCLRIIVENEKLHAFEWYKKRLVEREVEKFKFSSYKSSQYGSLGQELYKKYFLD